MENKKKKTKCGMISNVLFMLKIAWTKKEEKCIFFMLATAILAVALNLLELYISPTILGIIEKKESIESLLFSISFFVVCFMVVKGTYGYIDENVIFSRITIRTEIINMINEKSITTSYPNVFDKECDDLMYKACDATDSNSRASEAIWSTLTNLITNVFGLIIYVILLSTVNLWLILVICVTTIIGFILNKYLGEYRFRHRKEEGDKIKKLRYAKEEAKKITAAKDIRIFGLKQWLNEVSENAYNAYLGFLNKANGIYLWASLANVLLSFLRNAICYAYLINLVVTGQIGVSLFLLYFSTVGGFTTWITGVLSSINILHQQSLDISIIREYIEYPEPFVFEKGKALNIEDIDYEIRLENVSYKYPNQDNYILENINLTINPGEKIAIVGLNGAGKTTLVRIICGFLEPTKGRVLLNNVDIKEYNRKDYYKLFSAVFQKFSILAESIKINITQSYENIDLARVEECIEKAGLTKKVNSLPDGLDSKLNREVYDEAVNLSGGQIQRLMLARALYRDGKFIMLDEPTAALDPISESELYQRYNEMTAGKSSVYISHRLASTKFCNRILLIGEKRILEEGTHEELMALQGKYFDLFNVQSKYYQEGGDHDEE